jgi:hypothetical protein
MNCTADYTPSVIQYIKIPLENYNTGTPGRSVLNSYNENQTPTRADFLSDNSERMEPVR